MGDMPNGSLSLLEFVDGNLEFEMGELDGNRRRIEKIILHIRK